MIADVSDIEWPDWPGLIVVLLLCPLVPWMLRQVPTWWR